MTKRNIALALTVLALCGTAQAQDIYKIEALSGSDLSGTSRYVGMGGAMNALGADLSTMSTNPAAIGMYRRSDVAFTFGGTVQPDGRSMGDISKGRASFDQAGFVYSMKGGSAGDSYVNFGFNYQKRRNFKNFIGLDNVATPSGLSQSWQMQELAYYNGTALDLSPEGTGTSYTTPLVVNGSDAQMIYKDGDGNWKPRNSSAYSYYKSTWGSIQEYDLNLSANINNRLYLGATVGIYNVDTHSALAYGERLTEGNYSMTYAERLTGTGVDAKIGMVFRPIEESPFRIGLAVSTPTFYTLTQSGYLTMNAPFEYTDKNGKTYSTTFADYSMGDFDYRIRTPWRINISMATTVGSVFAVDAEYEVARYAGSQIRYSDGNGYTDYWGDYHNASTTRDREMDKEIDAYLNTVQQFRIGAEARLAPGLFLRAGYNFVSSPFNKNAYLNLYTNSPSFLYSLNTDYVNLGCINRATVGLGYRHKHFYADLSYQFQRQWADVYAFRATASGTGTRNEANLLSAQSVKLDRHNVMLTLGYKF